MSIVYTLTDESALVSSKTLVDVLNEVLTQVGVSIEWVDISLAQRLKDLCGEPSELNDGLSALDRLLEIIASEKNVLIKSPNISATEEQALAALSELIEANPNLATRRADCEQKIAQAIGSVVNPVIRCGNSVRFVSDSIKRYMASTKVVSVDSTSLTEIMSMTEGGFVHNEWAYESKNGDTLVVELVPGDNSGPDCVQNTLELKAGDVVDFSFLKGAAARHYFAQCLKRAAEQNTVASIHCKCTMMKISDPYLFGILLQELFKGESWVDQYGFGDSDDFKGGIQAIAEGLEEAGAPKDVVEGVRDLKNPLGIEWAYVDSDNRVSCIDTASTSIIDASMPRVMVDGGRVWDRNGELKDTLAIIPDATYAPIYEAFLADIKENGALDPAIMGSVENIGLMAYKAQEYGSNDKTCVIDSACTAQVKTQDGEVLFEVPLEVGDVWRGALTSRVAIDDWIELTLKRSAELNKRAIVWLDDQRAHDKVLKQLWETRLEGDDHGVQILNYADAMQATLDAVRKGESVIAATGNVLRDYLTDLFPIVEVGNSANVTSIVPQITGGLLLEAGAGGTAPVLYRELLEDGLFKWNPVGEVICIVEALRSQGEKGVGDALEQALFEVLADRLGESSDGEYDYRLMVFAIVERFVAALLMADSVGASDTLNTLSDNLNEHKSTIRNELMANRASFSWAGYYVSENYDTIPSKVMDSQALRRCLKGF